MFVPDGRTWGFSLPDAEETQTLLWQGRSSFSDVQLLSAVRLAGERAGSERFYSGARRSAQKIWICPGWFCRDAQSCAPADRGAKDRDALDDRAQPETPRVEEDAAREVPSLLRAENSSVSGRGDGMAAVLAKAILRFQRVQCSEEAGEARIHAPESRHATASAGSEGLGVEQLLFVFGERHTRGTD